MPTSVLPARLLTAVLIPTAALFAAPQAHAIDIGHRTTGDKAPSEGAQMAWRYRTLAAGLDAFERDVARLAPGATLAFALPLREGMEGIDGENKVVLQGAGPAIALPMVGPASFAIVRDQKAVDENAQVLANRRFKPGTVNHPNVQVRSPGLAPDTRRLGDLRLACATQMAMGRNDSLKLKAVLGVVGLFAGNLCEKVPVTHVDEPSGAFDSIVLEDGTRRVVQKIAGNASELVKLGDASWGNDTRIRYVAGSQPAQ